MQTVGFGRLRVAESGRPPNKRLEAGGARRLWNESFFSAPQLKRASLGSSEEFSVQVLDGVFRYFWFLMLAVILVNLAIIRPRMARLVERGRVTQDESDEFMREVAFAFGIPCVALGLIALWARWPSPMCAGALSFRDTPTTAASLVILGVWAMLLRWVWTGSGAEFLGRVAPVIMNPPNWERIYSPTLVRWAITIIVLVAAIGGAVTYRTMPQDMSCAAPSAAA
jgi:hypothetical protein